jgi:hypothetical protein
VSTIRGPAPRVRLRPCRRIGDGGFQGALGALSTRVGWTNWTSPWRGAATRAHRRATAGRVRSARHLPLEDGAQFVHVNWRHDGSDAHEPREYSERSRPAQRENARRSSGRHRRNRTSLARHGLRSARVHATPSNPTGRAKRGLRGAARRARVSSRRASSSSSPGLYTLFRPALTVDRPAL